MGEQGFNQVLSPKKLSKDDAFGSRAGNLPGFLWLAPANRAEHT